MKYILISMENRKFDSYCYLCRENIVVENLIENGGTLQVPSAVYYSNVIIMAFEEINNDVVGFAALNARPGTEVYVNQIAVKNVYKRKGIGRELVEQTMNYANGRDIICHVRDYNTASQGLFESCGFIKDEDRSEENNYFYRKTTNIYVRGKAL